MRPRGYKYYVVWQGIKPGLYERWSECKKSVECREARWKGYNSKTQAIHAFNSKPRKTLPKRLNDR
ncbi:MAG: RNase H1/viroplasmin domain-containing protein [Cyclobacteriaceae bacterium]